MGGFFCFYHFLWYMLIVHIDRKEDKMPMINFTCNNPDCRNSINKFFRAKLKLPPFLDCGQCGVGKLEKQLQAPSSKSTQVIDNGIQPRKTEVLNAVVEKERERLDSEE